MYLVVLFVCVQRVIILKITIHVLVYNILSVVVQLALEKKQGISNLELMCEELQEEERVMEMRRENKRQKRRKKKNKLKQAVDELDKENCMVRSFSLPCPLPSRAELNTFFLPIPIPFNSN